MNFDGWMEKVQLFCDTYEVIFVFLFWSQNGHVVFLGQSEHCIIFDQVAMF